MLITDAPALPGTATVEVTAEDTVTTLTYTINFTISPPGTDATLSDLLVDGITVAGFSPAVFNYDVELPYGTAIIPVVTASTNDANASMLITDAPALPGTATVEVTAEDTVTTLTYTINFTITPPGTDATLLDLLVDGITVAGFSPAVFNYDVELPYGTTIIPLVTAITNDANSSLLITDAAALPGIATVEVTAEDSITILIYTINFTVVTGIEIPANNQINIYPNPSNGIVTIHGIKRANIIVKDIAARIIVIKTITEKDNQIDLSGNNPGLYIIQTDIGGYSIYKKIVIYQAH